MRAAATTLGLLASALLALDAAASDVGDEVTFGWTHPVNATDPSQTTFFSSNDLEASFEVRPWWSVDPSVVVSHSEGSAPTLVGLLSSTLTFSDSWDGTLDLKASPALASATTVCLTKSGSKSCEAGSEGVSAVSAGVSTSYDSQGASDFQWGVDLGPSATYYGVGLVSGTVSKSTALEQYELSGELSARLFSRLRLGLRGSYFVYGDRGKTDPDVLIRHLAQSTGGLPVAPMQWRVAPSARLSITPKIALRVSAAGGPYEDVCSGDTVMGSAKATVKLKPFRLWASYTLQLDSPPQSAAVLTANGCPLTNGLPPPRTTSSYVAAGAEYDW